MKRFIDVHAGEIMAGRGEVLLKSDAKSECLVIAAYDPAERVGCLAHALFVSATKAKIKKRHSPILDVSGAIDTMIEDMGVLGAHKSDIEVCLVTGENVPHKKNDPAYNNKITAAIDLLRKRHIRCRNNTAADAGERHVAFDVGSGSISYK